MSEKNPTPISQNPIPVSKNPTAIPFSLDCDGIRNRILEIRDKQGLKNNADFSKLLFGHAGSKKVIDTWMRAEKPATPNIENLATIACVAGVSLDWLVFGKEKTPAQDTERKERTATTKEELYKSMLERRENDAKEKDAFIKHLLDTDHPVLQACSGFLNLLTYANVSIVGDFDIDSMDIPQTLTLKITPKCYNMRGYFDNDDKFKRSKFFIQRHRIEKWMTEEQKKIIESSTDMLFWDFRATLIQRLIAMSLDSRKKYYFDAPKLLKSIIDYMRAHGYWEYGFSLLSVDCKRLTHFSIYETIKKYNAIHGFLPVVNAIGALDLRLIDNLISENPSSFFPSIDYDRQNHSFFHADSAVCIRYCELQKAHLDATDDGIHLIW